MNVAKKSKSKSRVLGEPDALQDNIITKDKAVGQKRVRSKSPARLTPAKRVSKHIYIIFKELDIVAPTTFERSQVLLSPKENVLNIKAEGDDSKYRSISPGSMRNQCGQTTD